MINLNSYILEKLHLDKNTEPRNNDKMMMIMYKGSGAAFDKVFYQYTEYLTDEFLKTFAKVHDVISAYIGNENDLKEIEELNREKKFKEIPKKVKELGIKIKF